MPTRGTSKESARADHDHGPLPNPEKQVTKRLYNASGLNIDWGDVVRLGNGSNSSFIANTTLAFNSGWLGVAQAPIGSNLAGPVLLSGYTPVINVGSNSTPRGAFLYGSDVARRAYGSNTRTAGAFGQVLTTSVAPDAFIWATTDLATATPTVQNVQKSLTNKSGGTVNKGDVVVVDETTNESFTTSTTFDVETSLGIVQETIINNAAGLVALVGYVDLTNTASIAQNRGDYIYASSNAKIVHGSNTRNPGAFGQFLQAGSNSSAWIWGAGDQTAAGGVGSGSTTFVGAKAYADGTQSISDATLTAVAFNQEEYDTDGFHDNATNNSRFTVPAGKAGKYRLTGGVTLAAGASPVSAELVWRLNGTSSIRAGEFWLPSTTIITGGVITTEASLAVGDFVELGFIQDSSGARNIGSAFPDTQSFAAVSLIGT